MTHSSYRKIVFLFVVLNVVLFVAYMTGVPGRVGNVFTILSTEHGMDTNHPIVQRQSSLKQLPLANYTSTTSSSSTTTAGQMTTTSTTTTTTTTEKKVECDTTEVMQFMECAKAVVMTKSEAATLVKSVQLFSVLLEYHNITYIVFGGSLLGILRHGSFVPYDDDFDMIVLSRERDRIRKVMRDRAWPSPRDAFFNSTQERRELAKKLNFTEFNLLEYYDAHPHPKVYLNYKDCIHPRRYTFCWPFVDMFYFEDNGTHLYSREYKSNVFSYQQLFPLQRGPYAGVSLWIPNRPREFLAANVFTTCCSNGWLHKVERPYSCYKCIACSCLRDWIQLKTLS